MIRMVRRPFMTLMLGTLIAGSPSIRAAGASGTAAAGASGTSANGVSRTSAAGPSGRSAAGVNSARAQPVRIAGYVSAIDGRTSECLIVRGRKTVPAQYWADLLVGDEIVAKGDCRIEIMPRDGPRRWLVMASNSPTTLIDRARRQAWLPRVLEVVGAALSKWNDDLQPPLPVEPPQAVRVRGKKTKLVAPKAVVAKAAGLAPPPPPVPLAIPLLSGPSRQRLVLAPRRFNLAWIGGKPPFKVTLRNEQPDSLSANPPWAFDIGEERVVSSMIAPHPGSYGVRIVDAAGAAAVGQFDVVTMPPAIDQHDLTSLPQEIGLVVAAARLANMDGGVWRLEAHVRLADLGREDYAAALMAERLRAGKDLPDPPDLAGVGPAIATSSGLGAAGR